MTFRKYFILCMVHMGLLLELLQVLLELLLRGQKIYLKSTAYGLHISLWLVIIPYDLLIINQYHFSAL